MVEAVYAQVHDPANSHTRTRMFGMRFLVFAFQVAVYQSAKRNTKSNSASHMIGPAISAWLPMSGADMGYVPSMLLVLVQAWDALLCSFPVWPIIDALGTGLGYFATRSLGTDAGYFGTRGLRRRAKTK
eukprot:1023077-Rhodomonas_salina.1